MRLRKSDDVIKKLEQVVSKKYLDSVSSLKACSYDSHQDDYLCQLENEVYNFDRIKQKFCDSNRYFEMTSVDTLMSDKSKIYLIEFKNKSTIPYVEIRAKLFDSLLILEEEFELAREHFSCIELLVVYSPTKKARKAYLNMKNHLHLLAGNEKDEIEHFKVYKDKYGIKSFRLSSEDFEAYVRPKLVNKQ